ncbi:MAG: aminoglycoside phosphotransferase family protein [Lachnospiraceae bacterium]|nr:aminoglycoside phosphotransferase family protein [Lachnospiraceae bacterium]
MAAITKNRQSKETIIKMAKAAFPDKDVLHIKELTEGMCNVTYCITFQDGSESILKISAKDQSGNISNEIGLMRAEVEAMRLVAKHHTCKVADVGYYDCSRTICDGDYFFMEKLPGVNYSFVKDGMPKEKSRQIDEEIGRIQRELTHIQNHEFGFLGDEKRYPSLFEFVKVMLTNLLADAKSQNIDIALDEDTYLRRLDADRDVFSAVQSASLVHGDMWEGNVFVEQDHVSGIIDWERALWGEHNQNYL